jgi:8-oxo-dGTP pyrophosphatase MutT (NUDIX family)
MLDQLTAGLARALAGRSRAMLERPDKTVAAVLVPLLVVDGALHLLFTRRSTSLTHHQGQVAFPGGTRDPDDADLLATALREAHEEIGLAPNDVQILGPLDDLETMSSRFVITPFVGLVPHPYPWRPSPREVDAVFTVAVDRLREPGIEQRETWDFGGQEYPVDLYKVDGHVIWGATHRMTRGLLELLGRLT